MPKLFSLKREERLKSRKLIERVFSIGESFTIFPIRVIYTEVIDGLDFRIKAGVGVSSRNFKKAVERNRIKRLLREAYRTEKLPIHEYLEKHNKKVIIFLSYVDKTLPPYQQLKAKMPLIIRRLIKELDERNSKNT
jgi:ribonuclease P protein component